MNDWVRTKVVQKRFSLGKVVNSLASWRRIQRN